MKSISPLPEALGAELLEGQDHVWKVLRRAVQEEEFDADPSPALQRDLPPEERENEHDRPRRGSVTALGVGTLVALVVQAAAGQPARVALLHRAEAHNAPQVLAESSSHGGAKPAGQLGLSEAQGQVQVRQREHATHFGLPGAQLPLAPPPVQPC